MDSWTAASLITILSLSLSLLLKHLLLPSNSKTSPKPRLPPSASSLPVLIHIFFHRRSIFAVAPILRRFHALHGPIFTLRLFPFSRPSIYISDASLAHSALIHHGASFADRPPSAEPVRFLSVDNCIIFAAPYGSQWRLLRMNLSSKILHPSRIRMFCPARHKALRLLLDTLRSQSGQVVFVRE